MNIIKTQVTKESHVVVGALYLIEGSNAYGEPVPPALIRVTKKIEGRSITDLASFEFNMAINFGRGLRVMGNKDKPVRMRAENQQMYYWDVNIPEHGLHDRHLVRLSGDFIRTLTDFYKLDGYGEIAASTPDYAAAKPVILGPNGKVL